jgi:hypothetical protein
VTRIVWLFGWISVGIWSLFCALTYGLFDLFGRFVARNADAFSSDPQTVEWLWRTLNVLHSLSTGAIVVVWAVVSLLILAVPWVIDRMIGPANRTPVADPTFRGPAPLARDGGVIDLTPDQYSVGPRPSGSPHSGTTPRIVPRT